MLRRSQSLPAIASRSGTPAQDACGSRPGSRSVSPTKSPTKSQPGSPSRRFPQFNQTQFYSTPFDVAYEELAKARNLNKIEKLFTEADADGSGEMSRQEFRDAMRCPSIMKAFACLGVQPHQSELVFKSLDKRKTGELTITEFMAGLQAMVGSAPEGSGKELDINTLRPAYRSRLKHLSPCQSSTAAVRSNSEPRLGNDGKGSSIDLGPVHLLPKVAVQRAFTHSVAAQALHSATAARHPLKLIFPF